MRHVQSEPWAVHRGAWQATTASGEFNRGRRNGGGGAGKGAGPGGKGAARRVAMADGVWWVGREGRPWIGWEAYGGRGRRHKNEGPPDGKPRRRDDLPPEVGLAQEPNMSQDQVDGLFAARKVSL